MAGISVREFARRDGCSHTLVQRAIKTGHLSLLPDGTLDPALVGTGWRKTNRDGGNVPPGNAATVAAVATDESPAQAAERILAKNGAPYDLAEAERVKENFLALLRQLEYDQKAGSVVRVDRVAKTFGDACARVRTRLQAFPTEVAPEVHRQKTVAEVVEVLRRAINEALEELTRGGDGTGSED